MATDTTTTTTTLNPGDKYLHFKGTLYEIVCVAKHHEDGEDDIVIYKGITSGVIYGRPLAMFTSLVDKVKYPACTQELRFQKVYN